MWGGVGALRCFEYEPITSDFPGAGGIEDAPEANAVPHELRRLLSPLCPEGCDMYWWSP